MFLCNFWRLQSLFRCVKQTALNEAATHILCFYHVRVCWSGLWLHKQRCFFEYVKPVLFSWALCSSQCVKQTPALRLCQRRHHHCCCCGISVSHTANQYVCIESVFSCKCGWNARVRVSMVTVALQRGPLTTHRSKELFVVELFEILSELLQHHIWVSLVFLQAKEWVKLTSLQPVLGFSVWS